MPSSKAREKPAAARKALAKPASTSMAAPAKAARAAASGSLVQAPPKRRGTVTITDTNFPHSTNLYRVDPQTRIAAIRKGIPASMVGELSSTMGMSKELLLGSLGLSRATISRKEKDETVLSKDESERVLGIVSLIGKVQTMVEESGDPTGFDAARWVADWLAKPLPALGGATPASYMDTFEGQKLVAELLSMSQSGAYA
ncbi:MAG TPA: antitoxin Xre-like helix-turn-helix domain-containing protein [Burkholderiaceae bacterium]|jgi:putative toxin-antitoxin system antitoxin component (TIGR02293 family)|nr:antitoxin Xre-like helix-turn-helix domain-containing protein [Burkholderiaceae bacterium]